MPTPFVHTGLTAACLAVAMRPFAALDTKQRLKLFATAALLANSPDLDLLPALFDTSLWYTYHRWCGHNLFAVAGWIVLGRLLLELWVWRGIPRLLAWGAPALLVLSHLVFDGLSAGIPSTHPTVPIFWPVSKALVGWGVPIFPGVPFPQGGNVVIGMALSREYWTHGFWVELAFSLVFLGAWTLLWNVYTKLARRTGDEDSVPGGDAVGPGQGGKESDGSAVGDRELEAEG